MLATKADVLLMDEAFSALDPLIKSDMQEQLKEIQARLKKTIIFITHDLDEALHLGDRIAILKDGELRQLGGGEDILDAKAAKRLLVRLLKKQGLAPKRIVTDKLRSYGAARRDVMSAVEHRLHKGLNNRAENSHVPLRIRERIMQGFRSVGGLQRFISVFSALRNLFVPPHRKRSAVATNIHRIRAMPQWKAVTGATASIR